MAYEIFIEASDEKSAPPDQNLLALSWTGPGNGYPAVIHVDVVSVDETFETRTYTRLAGVTVNAEEFITAVLALHRPERK